MVSLLTVICVIVFTAIAGIGWGLFVRPDWYGTFYRKNIVMCLYCKITLSNKPIRQLPSQDYVDGGRDTGRLTTFWFVHKYKASRTVSLH